MDDITSQIFDPDDIGVADEIAAKILRVKRGTLATWRSQGRGPKYRKSGRRVEYTPRFLREYLEANVCVPELAESRRQRDGIA